MVKHHKKEYEKPNCYNTNIHLPIFIATPINHLHHYKNHQSTFWEWTFITEGIPKIFWWDRVGVEWG
jgi:hypothetical protein